MMELRRSWQHNSMYGKKTDLELVQEMNMLTLNLAPLDEDSPDLRLVASCLDTMRRAVCAIHWISHELEERLSEPPAAP